MSKPNLNQIHACSNSASCSYPEVDFSNGNTPALPSCLGLALLTVIADTFLYSFGKSVLHNLQNHSMLFTSGDVHCNIIDYLQQVLSTPRYPSLLPAFLPPESPPPFPPIRSASTFVWMLLYCACLAWRTTGFQRLYQTWRSSPLTLSPFLPLHLRHFPQVKERENRKRLGLPSSKHMHWPHVSTCSCFDPRASQTPPSHGPMELSQCATLPARDTPQSNSLRRTSTSMFCPLSYGHHIHLTL